MDNANHLKIGEPVSDHMPWLFVKYLSHEEENFKNNEPKPGTCLALRTERHCTERIAFLAPEVLPYTTILTEELPNDLASCLVPNPVDETCMVVYRSAAKTRDFSAQTNPTLVIKTDDVEAMTNAMLRVYAGMREQGIYHRDLKPMNLMLLQDESDNREYLVTDFGNVNVAGTTAELESDMRAKRNDILKSHKIKDNPFDEIEEVVELRELIEEKEQLDDMERFSIAWTVFYMYAVLIGDEATAKTLAARVATPTGCDALLRERGIEVTKANAPIPMKLETNRKVRSLNSGSHQSTISPLNFGNDSPLSTISRRNFFDDSPPPRSRRNFFDGDGDSPPPMSRRGHQRQIQQNPGMFDMLDSPPPNQNLLGEDRGPPPPKKRGPRELKFGGRSASREQRHGQKGVGGRSRGAKGGGEQLGRRTMTWISMASLVVTTVTSVIVGSIQK